MTVTTATMRAALAGARSVRVRGWMGDECQLAALEALVRYPTDQPSRAYTVGKRAAVDELRRLTGWRRMYRSRLVPLDGHDRGVEEAGFGWVEVEQLLARCSPRVRPILRGHMAGLTWAEAGRRQGLSASRTSQLVRRDSRRSRAA